MHPACLSIDDLLEECSERRLRRGGPGGQHRNKVETAVELTHLPTGVAAEANERRSQSRNREAALQRLRVRLALAVRSESTEGAIERGPSGTWAARCRGGKLSVAVGHTDFPALLAEALDTLSVAEWAVATAAERLGVSTSQLVKLLKLEPAALGLLNDQRRAVGLGPLT